MRQNRALFCKQYCHCKWNCYLEKGTKQSEAKEFLGWKRNKRPCMFLNLLFFRLTWSQSKAIAGRGFKWELLRSGARVCRGTWTQQRGLNGDGRKAQFWCMLWMNAKVCPHPAFLAGWTSSRCKLTLPRRQNYCGLCRDLDQ